MAKSWGGTSSLSMLCQALKKLQHYPANLQEAMQDIGKPPNFARVQLHWVNNQLVTAHTTEIGRSEAIAYVFSKVPTSGAGMAGGGAHLMKYGTRAVGHWKFAGTQTAVLAVYFVRVTMKRSIETYLDEQWGRKRPSPVQSVMAAFDGGQHDEQIADWIGVLHPGDYTGPKAGARKSLSSSDKKTDVKPLPNGRLKKEALNALVPSLMKKWRAVYKDAIRNPEKAAKMESVAKDTFVVPKNVCVETGDALDVADWLRVLKAAEKNKVWSKDMHTVVITSPPHGVLNIEENPHDVVFTPMQMDKFVSSCASVLTTETPILLHLPFHDIHHWVSAFQARGYKVCQTATCQVRCKV